MISLEFFGILILSLILYWVIPKQSLRNLLLILASFAFIYLLDKWSVVVVLGLSAVSYLFGVLINKYPKRGWIHACGVILVLGVLILFKYLGFLGGIFNRSLPFSYFFTSKTAVFSHFVQIAYSICA
jgi:D-alanyl-lipoteichoic acid acyltransferase DltB (MBOAT superfamily)